MSATQPQTLPTGQPPSWQPDPTRRHQHRYFDGARWTDHVADRGQSTTDPYTLPPPPAGPTVPAAAPPDPAPAPAASQDPTVPIWARSANTQAEAVSTEPEGQEVHGADWIIANRAVSTEPEGQEVYGSGTLDFVIVLILCLLFPIVSLWYGPKLLVTGHVLRGIFVLAMTAVWYSILIQTL